MSIRFHSFVQMLTAVVAVGRWPPQRSAETTSQTALVAAAKARDRAAVQALLDRRADPNAPRLTAPRRCIGPPTGATSS